MEHNIEQALYLTKIGAVKNHEPLKYYRYLINAMFLAIHL